jgi:hypothetical protein
VPVEVGGVISEIVFETRGGRRWAADGLEGRCVGDMAGGVVPMASWVTRFIQSQLLLKPS